MQTLKKKEMEMKNPEAYIAKNKNRLRVYNQNTVYLNNGDEFQLEFFNPTSKTILARFSFNENDNSIGTGLIIRPGERVFLDRYLDKVKKFKFETYDVENTSESKQAIQDNGKVNISFFNERNLNYFTNYPVVVGPNYYPKPIEYTYSTYGTTFTSDCINTNYVSCGADLVEPIQSKLTTGRIGIGDISNQKLTDIDMNFEVFSFWNINYLIKPIENKTTDSFAVYCTSCGYRKRKSQWKVCPICGNEFEF